MTDDPQLWRSMLIVLVILTALFGALLLLVGLYRRGHVPGRVQRSPILEETLRSVRAGR
jgi:hypothetical protein